MVKNLIIKTVSFYQARVSPLLGNHCRFYPSCSQYIQEAIATRGLFMGVLKGFSRLLRCHPLSAGGYDPLTK